MKNRQITAKKGSDIAELEKHLLSEGYKELNHAFENLRGKNATEKITVYAYRWAGEWAGYVKIRYTIFYK